MPVTLNPIAASSTLATVEQLKTWLGVADSSQDAKLSQMLVAATAAIENYCKCGLIAADRVEVVNGTGTAYCRLSACPINDITSITIDAHGTPTVVEGESFTFDEMAGLVRCRDDASEFRWFPEGFRNISVSYNGGYSVIPGDLAMACCMVAGGLYKGSNRDSALKSESIGQYSYMNFEPSVLASAIIGGDPQVQYLLGRYVRVEA